jgi:AcrR family transcriptional regulator
MARRAPLPAAPTPPKEQLSAALIVRTAVGLADRHGSEAFSMRRLADELGAAPMALYRHIAHKDELLDRMVDVVFAEVEIPTGVGWRQALRERAISKREALLRHPWAIGQMESRAPGPANRRHHHATLRCLRRAAGLSTPQAVHAYSLMDSYIYGFAFQQASMAANGATQIALRAATTTWSAVPEDEPDIADMIAEIARSGYDFDAEFTYGLDVLLDAVERIRGEDGPT